MPEASAAIRDVIDAAADYLSALNGPGTDEVREGLRRWREKPVRPGAASTLPVVNRWLVPALSAMETNRKLAFAIAGATPHLGWQRFHGYKEAEIGANFASGNAYVPLIGESPAPVQARDWELGLFLLEPNLVYRDHKHAAPELYAPLTGPHGWRFGVGSPLEVVDANVPVWNPPHRVHLTKVGRVPFLCLYVWTRDVNSPAEVIPASDWSVLDALRVG